MTMRIIFGNILDAEADAILLSVDGNRRGLEGNLARQFERRFPDWGDIQRTIHSPIPLGRTVAVPWNGDCPWRVLLIASTLHHLDVLSDADKQLVVRNAFFEALVLCQRHSVATLSTTVLRGGWRLQLDQAFLAMQSVWLASGSARHGLKVNVFVQQESEMALLSALQHGA
ncbi:hypothetical protein [Propionivibrio dicarboxylicus]|uniref:Macro domain-containing protein n=1 Tax=Propionivibrio dicarboxylicus TaxID=83767 RepID=A0A1G8NK09_9RHOO|nr:hypothetical protein [Propionivibrio dicarboxylicus]SDI80564.1 hypothetical protein SAMN05660652_04064 [Propionivibrio dicarboxylicus]